MNADKLAELPGRMYFNPGLAVLREARRANQHEARSWPRISPSEAKSVEAAFDAAEAQIVSLLDRAEAAEALVEEMREGLVGCEGVESGPNGRGGMRVVAHFPKPGDELALFNLLSHALIERTKP